MRFIVLVLGLLALSAKAATYDVTATMPATTGATSCQLYMGGVAVGATKTCGTAQSYPALIPTEGTYQFAYKAVNAGGQSALSPVTTVTIAAVTPPVDPGTPPTVSIVCTPSPCPSSIVITITP